ncbi:fasciclin domain-containing protein [uncultured Polaribacter sp.]|uniref:fasciclin domain-containing protein n=1 Tax=uncultured Polaribacter sp. TaxID=174711 RepID=UPI00262D9FF0|nr:fasciclin domain-containing protein [uncultured Polaribacter sp.]
MKQNRLKQYFFTMAFAFIAMVSCNVPEDNDELIPFVPEEVTNPETISQFIIANPELSIFERALRTIEAAATNEDDLKIITELNVPGNSTVFAPSNEAFNVFLDRNGIDDVADLPVDVLINVVLYHILEGELMASDLTTGYINTRSLFSVRVGRTTIENNLSLYINTAEGVTLNRDTNVITPNIDANNGVIHIVDRVVDLPTVANLIGVNPTLARYIAAVRRADTFINEEGETPNRIERSLRNGGSIVTAFVPTNEAFDNYLLERDNTGSTTTEDIAESELGRITKTHILPAYIPSSLLVSGSQQTLLDDNEIVINAENLTITDPQARISNINADVLNIQGTNGVLHLIDNVILPSDPPAADM